MSYGTPGIPTNPPFIVTGTPSDGDVPTSDGAGGIAWEAGGGGGGSGITIEGTIGDGQTVVWEDTDNVYIPTLAGAPVYSVKNPISYDPPGSGTARMVRAAGTNLQTTGTISGSSTSLSVTSASGWARGHGIYIVGAGAAHGLSAPAAPNVTPQGTSGATSRDYRVAVLSGDGGWTECGTIATITTSNATLSLTNFDFLALPAVAGAKAYAIYGTETTDANHYLLTIVNGQPTALAIQLDPGATGCVAGDIGKTVVQGTHDGILLGYDNTARLLFVDPTVWGTDTFNGSGGSVTITTGTGAGTQTSAATSYITWKNCGVAETATPFKHLGRRSSSNVYVGELMLHPVSVSGNLYRCVRIKKDGTTAGSAPTFDTAIGALTVDGDATWRRENQCVSVTPPSAAMPNAMTTHITDISGTTFTLADAATTTATSQPVMHCDLSAALAHNAAMLAAGAESGTLHWPAGDYDLRPGTPVDDGAGNDARWTATAIASDDCLFNLFAASNSNKTGTEIEWRADGASIWFAPTDSPARLVDDSSNAALTDIRYFIDINSSAITFRGGRYIYAPTGCAPMEHLDAWNWYFFSRGNTPTRGPRFYNVDLLAWPRHTAHGDELGSGQEEVWQDCDLTYGGAGHDGALYFAGARMRGCSLAGIRFDRSLGIYQDDNSYNTGAWITDCVFKSLLQNGIRIRLSGFYFARNRCFDFENFIASSGDDAKLISNTFTRCNIGITVTDKLDFSHNTLIDSWATLSAPSLICNFNRSIATASLSLTTTVNAFILSGGAGGGQYIGNHVDLTAYTPGQSLRDWSLTGSGNWHVAHNTHLCEAVFSFRSACTGTVVMEDNYVNTSYTGPSGITPVAGNGTYTLRDNNWVSGSALQPLEISAGSNVVMDNDRLSMPISVSNITGPFEMHNTKIASSTASTIAKNGARLINNDFGGAPTLTGTLLYTKGNTIAGVAHSSPAALAIGASALTLPVTDYVRLDPNASNSSLSGMTARASGVEVFTVNVDAGAATLTYTNNSGVTEADEYLTDTGADFVDSANKTRAWWYDSTTAKWRNK